MASPTIRASVCKSVLDAVDSLGDARATQVRDVYGAERIETVENAGPFAWIEWDHQGAMDDAIANELHEEAALLFWQDLALKSMQKSAFKAIVDTAFRLLGTSPGALLNYWHLGYKVAAKDWGEMEAEAKGDREVLMTLRNAPHEVLRPSYVHAHRGSLLAACAKLGYEGTTRVVDFDRDQGVLDVLISWTPKLGEVGEEQT